MCRIKLYFGGLFCGKFFFLCFLVLFWMHTVDIFKLEHINWTIEYLFPFELILKMKLWNGLANAYLDIYGDFSDLISIRGFFLYCVEWKNDPFLRSFIKQSGVVKMVIMMPMNRKRSSKKPAEQTINLFYRE